jgi:ammonium transporter, Amt family
MRIVRPALTVAILAATTAANAQPVIIADSGDSAWVLSASLVALFALLAGLGMGKPRRGVLLLATAITSLVWAMAGYSLAFGEGSSLLGGMGNLGLTELADLREGTTLSEPVYVLFEMVFPIAAVALLSAQLANVRLAWSAAFVPLWSLLVYVPVARWMWGGGWLADAFALDFAGGLTLHVTSGFSALILAIIARHPAYEDDRSSANAVLMWVGFLALAGASALGAGVDAANAMIDVQIAASAGALVWVMLDRNDWERSLACGATAGLAASASGAGFLGVYGGALSGICGAIAAWAAARATRRWFVHDSKNVFAMHGVAGLTGALTLPLFSLPVFGGGIDGGQTVATQFVSQVMATASILLWTGGVTMVVALMVTMVVPMRSTTDTKN